MVQIQLTMELILSMTYSQTGSGLTMPKYGLSLEIKAFPFTLFWPTFGNKYFLHQLTLSVSTQVQGTQKLPKAP